MHDDEQVIEVVRVVITIELVATLLIIDDEDEETMHGKMLEIDVNE